jgi:hypothetical protein
MGFGKRYISKELILSTRNNGERVSGLFLSDAVICTDSFSSEILYLFLGGATEEELKTKVHNHIHLE